MTNDHADLWATITDAGAHDYAPRWTGTLPEYLDRLRQDPRPARLAHARLDAAIRAQGVRDTAHGPEYAAFDGQLFGMAPVLRQVLDYTAAAAARADAHRRVLLLVGPVGTAKSHLVTLLKRSLEAYSRTPEGALYGLVDCPLHEDPLHAIPAAARPAVGKALGLVIDGDLCPRCRSRLDRAEGDLSTLRVEQLALSEARRLGIATYAAGEEKTQSLSDLVGKVDLAKLAQVGSEDDPEVFDFRGELDAASRGLFEGIELLKWVPELLYTLITVSQERQIKAPGFPVTYLDTVLIGTTNSSEYRRYISDAKNEAIRSRLYVVRVPYVLRVQDEEAIYRRLVAEASLGQHVAPGTLTTLAQYAVLSRLTTKPKDKSVSLWDRLRLYNGEQVADIAGHRVEDLRQEDPDEGMQGLSPRDSMNVLTQALGVTAAACVTPLDVLKTLQRYTAEGRFLAHQGPEAQQALHASIGLVRQAYDKTVRETAMTAFVHAFDSAAQTLFTRYLDEAEATVRKTPLRDTVTGDVREADEKFLRSIEEQLNVGTGSARGFREELLVAVGAAARHGQPLRWSDHPRLSDAIKQRLFSDVKNLVRTTTSTRTPDAEQQERLETVRAALTAQGYCTHCANQLMDYAGLLVSQDS